MTDNDDRLVFLDENVEDLEGERGRSRNWKVLIVDDDEDVHHSTVFAMQNVLILDRPLEFLHAYTAREAVDILMHESDIAVILLDVVMETDDAGLRTVDIIRNELHLLNVRIILRTGQPGQAPELEAITSYDINEYKTKNEFTRRKLFTSLTTAIRSYNQLQQLDASRQGLEKIIEASNSFISQQGLYGFAEGVITQISGLIGVVPEGLVCAGSLKKPEEGGNLISQWVVIAAAGKFSGYMCQDINEIRDDKIVQALKASLDRKENILTNKSVSLYFETPHKQGFAVYIASDHPIKEVDQQLIQIFCSNIALYADNITMVSRLQRQAYFDGLVNLPNRAALLRELDQSILEPRVDRSLLAIIDVDQFSAINYMLGPRYGDRLLRIIGQRLKSTYPDCYVARVSSDIFAVLGDANTITPFTIKEVFREPFRFEDVDHPLTVCCGIVTLTDVAGDGSDAIQCAYVALKRAKSLGLGQQARYSAAIANETNERTRLLHELHKAFGHDRLFPVFQPQLDLKTNKVCGFEALLRWRGEDNNYIPPSQFIPISEQSSIIISLGSWILRTSLLRLKSLHNLGYEGLRMSVNVSVVQLRQPDFVDVLEKALQDTGMEARDLELEITESIAAIGVVDVGRLLGAVRNLGVSVAIDDFGTGFSALSYLEKMPADRIKIDKTFIDALGRGPNGPKIAEMIIPLGHQMGMEVVAEGVEELEQLKLLRELGCDLIQGYYFAKPMAFEDLLLWLEKHKTAGK